MRNNPNIGPCSPTPATPGGNGSIDNPCAMLPQLRAAYYALIGGQQTAEIRDNNRILRFHAGNRAELKAEIRKLEALCPAGPGNPLKPQLGAVRAGPFTDQPGVHPGFSNPRRY